MGENLLEPGPAACCRARWLVFRGVGFLGRSWPEYRQRHPWRTVFAFAPVALAVAVGVAQPPPVGADTNDDFAYCTALNRQGFHITDCALLAAIGMGQCAHFERGRTASDAMQTAESMWGIAPKDAEIIMRTAVAVYCPIYERSLPPRL